MEGPLSPTTYETYNCTGTPDAPVTSISPATNSGTITLTWSPVSGADRYRIYRCDGSGSCAPSVEVAHDNGSPYIDSGLIAVGASGHIYRYRVRAENLSGGGLGSFSNTVQSVTLPSAPSNMSISASPVRVVKGGDTVLSWTSTGAAQCTVTGPEGEVIAGSCSGTPEACNGSVTVTISEESEFRMDCTNAGGASNETTVVEIIPQFDEI